MKNLLVVVRTHVNPTDAWHVISLFWNWFRRKREQRKMEVRAQECAKRFDTMILCLGITAVLVLILGFFLCSRSERIL